MTSAGPAFRKVNGQAPPGFFHAEAAGLAWLAAATADGGVPVVAVRSYDQRQIELDRLIPVTPSRAQAQEFGRRLAATHRSGASWFGQPPPQLAASGFIASLPLLHDCREDSSCDCADDSRHMSGRLSWGQFYARLRLAPFVRAAVDAGALDPAQARVMDRICTRLEDGDEDLTGPVDAPSRLHGDLWSGNVIWTSHGAVLIDPAAHGGHRETDLAMLALFGLPHLDAVIAAYDEAYPLSAGWAQRVALHQLHPLLVHTVLFGSSYGAQATQAGARYS